MELKTDQLIPPVLTQRYEQVAAVLETEIRSGSMRPGDRLPAERDLAHRIGVSRATVREALGALQVAGLVETRQGSGSFVVDVPPPAVPILELPADASPAAVLQARAIIEPSVAAMAASAARRDPTIIRLLEIMSDSGDPTDPKQRQRWSDSDREFHRRFAYLTGNPVLIAVADYLAELMDQPLWRRLRDDSIAVPGRTTLQLAEHRLIAAAVEEGDSSAASSHMTEHINRARRYMALAE